ncbi:unnamed protein product [Lampetra planeri]
MLCVLILRGCDESRIEPCSRLRAQGHGSATAVNSAVERGLGRRREGTGQLCGGGGGSGSSGLREAEEGGLLAEGVGG